MRLFATSILSFILTLALTECWLSFARGQETRECHGDVLLSPLNSTTVILSHREFGSKEIAQEFNCTWTIAMTGGDAYSIWIELPEIDLPADPVCAQNHVIISSSPDFDHDKSLTLCGSGQIQSSILAGPGPLYIEFISDGTGGNGFRLEIKLMAEDSVRSNRYQYCGRDSPFFMHCLSGRCLPISMRCDGVRDCPANEDESQCAPTLPPPTTTISVPLPTLLFTHSPPSAMVMQPTANMQPQGINFQASQNQQYGRPQQTQFNTQMRPPQQQSYQPSQYSFPMNNQFQGRPQQGFQTGGQYRPQQQQQTFYGGRPNQQFGSQRPYGNQMMGGRLTNTFSGGVNQQSGFQRPQTMPNNRQPMYQRQQQYMSNQSPTVSRGQSPSRYRSNSDDYEDEVPSEDGVPEEVEALFSESFPHDEFKEKHPPTRCGTTRIRSSWKGEIRSPEHPLNYPPNANCLWHIDLPQSDAVLHLKFAALNFGISLGEPDAENVATSVSFCRSDHVTLYEVRGSRKVLLGRFCGKTPPLKRFNVKSGRALVHFQSDGSSQSTGFSLSYFSTGGDHPRCNKNGIRLDEPTGELTSPNFGLAKTYPPSTMCTWWIVSPHSKKVVVDVLEFKMEKSTWECEYDFLMFQDVSGVLGRFCGTQISSVLESKTNWMKVVFRSDKFKGDKGFRLVWRFEDRPVQTTTPKPTTSADPNKPLPSTSTTTEPSTTTIKTRHWAPVFPKFAPPGRFLCNPGVSFKHVPSSARCDKIVDCPESRLDEENCGESHDRSGFDGMCGRTGRFTPILGRGFAIGNTPTGLPTKPHSWPWHASLRYRGNHVCSATVVHQKWALTSAACLKIAHDFLISEHVENQVISSDSWDLLINTHASDEAAADLTGGLITDVDKFVVYPEFDPITMKNDIVLVRIFADISKQDDGSSAFERRRLALWGDINEAAQDASLIDSQASTSACLTFNDVIVVAFSHAVDCYIVGWWPPGDTENALNGFTVKNALRQVAIQTIRQGGACSKSNRLYAAWKELDSKKQLCVGDSNGAGWNSCTLESGSALMCYLPSTAAGFEGEKSWSLVGIGSWGSGCADYPSPGIFTRVSAYQQWIAYNTGS